MTSLLLRKAKGIFIFYLVRRLVTVAVSVAALMMLP